MAEAFIMRRYGENTSGDIGLELVGESMDLGGESKTIPGLKGCKGFHIYINEVLTTHQGPNNFIYSLTYISGRAAAVVRTEETENPAKVVGKLDGEILKSFDESTGTITLQGGYVFAKSTGIKYTVYKIS